MLDGRRAVSRPFSQASGLIPDKSNDAPPRVSLSVPLPFWMDQWTSATDQARTTNEQYESALATMSQLGLSRGLTQTHQQVDEFTKRVADLFDAKTPVCRSKAGPDTPAGVDKEATISHPASSTSTRGNAGDSSHSTSVASIAEATPASPINDEGTQAPSASHHNPDPSMSHPAQPSQANAYYTGPHAPNTSDSHDHPYTRCGSSGINERNSIGYDCEAADYDFDFGDMSVETDDMKKIGNEDPDHPASLLLSHSQERHLAGSTEVNSKL